MHFPIEWWTQFAIVWNAEPQRQRFAGLGTIAIIFSDAGGVSVELTFDGVGDLAEISRLRHRNIPSFSASSKTWTRFVTKDLGAVAGVFLGLIRYKGPTSLVLRFGQQFNLLAEVGSRVPGTTRRLTSR